MDKNTPLLPFAYTASSFNEKDLVVYDTSPRNRQVIDINASSRYHTRLSQQQLPPTSEHTPEGPKRRVPLPANTKLPNLKRKLTSYSENDHVKRFRDEDIGLEDDTQDDIELPPLSPPALASEYDMYTSQHFNFPPTLPDHHPTLEATQPDEAPRAMPQPSLEADFGIDRFNRFKSSMVEAQWLDGVGPETASQASKTARELILLAFEATKTTIDLQGMGLAEIPDEIKDMNNLVVIGGLPVYQLYASNNQLRLLAPLLFEFTKLNVLTLRHNKLTEIPPGIGNLVGLRDLNIGSNQIMWLPWQFLRLAPQLATFGLGPNPFRPVDATAVPVDAGMAEIEGARQQYQGEIVYCGRRSMVPLLKQRCLHQLAMYDISYADTKQWKRAIPTAFHDPIKLAIRQGKYRDTCSQCPLIVVEPMAEVYEWWDICNNKLIPIRRQFCSERCVQRYQQGERF